MRRIIFALIFVLSAVIPASAQTNTINTIAGGGTQPSAATSADIPQPWTAVRDIHGNTYISAPSLNVVYKVDTSGALTTYAGTGTPGNAGDGGPATQAELAFPAGLALDVNGNLFIADSNNNRIRRVDTSGNITTVAGSGDTFFGGFSGDNGPATSAQLNVPSSVAVDGNGDLFITDTDNGLVRRVDGNTQVITTFAGGGKTFGCNGGAGNTAGFSFLNGIAVDGTGNVFIADVGLGIVCKVDATTHDITTYAGTINNFGQPGAANGDGGPATSAQMDQPNGVAVDSQGNLFITDSGNPKIRKVDTTASHIITSIAGTGFICFTAEPACGDGAAATSASFDFPRGVFVDSNNNIIVTDTFDMRVRVVAAGANPIISAFAGGGAVGDGGPATSAILADPTVVVVDAAENIFELEQQGLRLRRIDATTKVISTYAGAGLGGATIGLGLNGDGGPATNARFVNPTGLATDSAGNYYIVDSNLAQVKKVDTSNPPIITTIAGNGAPCGVAGNPNTTPGCGDGGAATSASLSKPIGVAVDSQGNVYISDTGLNTVRVVTASTGNISTFAGISGSPCQSTPASCGDGGPATSAQLNVPVGLAVDSSNNLFIADGFDNVIRIVNIGSKQIFTFAFSGLPSFGGDGGPATDASMDFPEALAVDSAGNLFISGGDDNVVRRVDRQDQTIVTVAGDVNNLDGGFSGDGGPSTQALLENFGVAVFNNANGTHDVFVADGGNGRIRKVNIAPVAPGQPATGATLTFPPTLDGQVSDPQSIQFTNTGLDRLVFSNITLSNQNFVLFNSCNQGGAGPTGSCALQIEFAPPPGAAGTLTGTLTFNTNDPANPSYTYHLSGTATNASSTLNITESGTGTGVVTSDPPGIICPTTCAGTFATGATVTVTAQPNPGSSFSNWDTGNAPGAVCTGNSCVVTLGFSQTLNAVFSSPANGTFTINVSVLGNGAGNVTSVPANGGNITCTAANSPCLMAFPAFTPSVTLKETFTGPAGGFAGWLGEACINSGTGPCVISSVFSGTDSVAAVFSGPAKPFAKGQVFLSTDEGMVFVLDPTAGAIVQVLSSGNTGGFGNGVTFDKAGNLILANSDANTVLTFNNQGAGPTLFGDAFTFNQPFSPVVDPFGNVFIGQTVQDGDRLLEFSSGENSATFFPAFEGDISIANWVELLASSDRVAYTLGTQTVKIIDLGEDFQRPDLVTNLHGAFALRQLPDASLLVADTDRIVRLDENGNIVKTYTVPGVAGVFQNLNLDPDGATFWTDDQLTGQVYRINIGSGAVANGVGFFTDIGLNAIPGTLGIGGIAVFGQPAAGGADLAVTMTGPATLSAGGTATYTIVAKNNGPLNATGVTMAAFIQNGESTITSFSSPPGVSCLNQINVGTGDDTRFCTIGAMASGASDTFSVSVQPTGTITNSATMADSAPADPNLLNNVDSVTTTVSAATLVSIAVTPNPASVGVGGTQQFTATGTFSDTSTQNLTSTATWSSGNTAIATINAAGLASGVKAGGPIAMTATSATISGSAQLTVTAPTLVSIAVTPNPASVVAGSTQQFTATGTFSDNSTQNLTTTATWTSSNTAIATINAAGLASGVTAGGPVTIKAAQSGINGTAALTVTAAPPPTFTLTVATAGTGNGTVTSQAGLAPAISCSTGSGTGCTASYSSGQSVVLTATPLASNNSTFAGWSGACTNVTGTCSVTMNQAQSVTATFNVPAGGAPSFLSTALLAGAVGIPYGADILVTGGTPPYTFALTSGALPTAFTLVTTTSGTIAAGHIFGSPAAASNTSFGITVTDSAQSAATATISLTIATAPPNTQASLLNGRFALLTESFSEGTGFNEAVGSLNFDGKSSVTGVVDLNGSNGVTTALAVNGTYSIGPDNRGFLTLNSATQGTVNFAMAVGNVYRGAASTVRITQFNDNDANDHIGTGILRQQDPTSFTQNAFAGTYAFGLSGQTPQATRSVYVGLQTFDNAGKLTNETFDFNDGGVPSGPGTTSGTYVAPDNNGRIVLNAPVGFQDVIYQISANEYFFLSLNPQSGGNDVAAGSALRQANPGTFGASSLTGPDVLTAIAAPQGGGTDTVIALATASAGTMSVTLDENNAGTLTTNGTLSGALTVSANGRATAALGQAPLILYFAQPDRAFVMDTGATVGFGQLVPQVGAPFSASPLRGNLFFGEQESVSSGAGGFSGIALLGSGNTLAVTNDESDTGGDLSFDQSLTTVNFTVASNGHFSATRASSSSTLTGYVISPFEVAFFSETSNSGNPTGSPALVIAQTQTTPPGIPSPATSTVTFAAAEPVGTSTPSAPITITNTGLGPLGISGTGVPPDYAFDGSSTCIAGTVILQPGGTCTIVIDFKPLTVGALNETLTVTTDGTANITINVSGTAVAAGTTITFSANPVAFPNSVAIGATQTANNLDTLTNNSAASVQITGVTQAADFTAQGQCFTGLPVTVAAAGNCSINIKFAPALTTAPGALNETITVQTSVGNFPFNVTGTAIPGGAGQLNPNPFTFTNPTQLGQSQTVNTAVTLANSGTGPLHVTAVTNAVDFSAAGQCFTGLPVTVAPNGTCTINLTFAPSQTTTPGALSETITIQTDAGNLSLGVKGTATNPVISISPSSTVNFGNQLVGTASGAITTTVTNTGNQAITLTTVTLAPAPNGQTGTNPQGFAIVNAAGVVNCTNGTGLQPNGVCVLAVTFTPPAAGAVTSTITLTDSLGNQVITLNGTGTAPTITLNPASLSFSTAPDTTSATQSVSVTNSGAAPLHIANVTLGGDTEDFALVNGTTPCAKGVTVQPQAACTVSVNFTAPSQATFNATVTITSDASNGTQTIPLTGTGVVISITPPPGGTTTATTNPGGTAVFPLILSSTGITGTATLSCVSPSTPTITCTVVPGTVPLTPNGITHTAIVVNTFCRGTTPSSGSVPGSPTQNLPPAPWLIAIVGLALLASMALTKKRSLRLVMPLAALLLAGVFASSCGSPPKGPAGITPPGVYPLVITATVGQASSSITLTLTVN